MCLGLSNAKQSCEPYWELSRVNNLKNFQVNLVLIIYVSCMVWLKNYVTGQNIFFNLGEPLHASRGNPMPPNLACGLVVIHSFPRCNDHHGRCTWKNCIKKGPEVEVVPMGTKLSWLQLNASAFYWKGFPCD